MEHPPHIPLRSAAALAWLVLGVIGRLGAQDCSPPLFASDTAYLDDVAGAVTYCLAGGADLSGFDLALDGQTVTAGTEASCGVFDDPGPYFYDFSGVPDGGLGGEIYVRRWAISGSFVMDRRFADARDLAALFLRVDPMAGWRYDDATQRIASTVTTGSYATLQIRWEPTSANYDLPLRPADAPGATVTLPEPGRTYVVTATARDASCAETLVIVRRGGRGGSAPTPSTERYVVAQDGDTGQLCVATDEVPAATATTVCGEAANGMIRILGVGCFAYRPTTGFSGTDGGCIVTCDDAARCDTTYLAFTVSPASPDCGTFEVDGASRLEAPSCVGSATLRIRRTDDGTDAVAFTADGAPATATLDGGVYALELPVGTRRVTAAAGGAGCGQAFAVEVVCDDGTPGPCVLPFDEELLGQGVVCGGVRREVLLPATPEELADFDIVVDGVAYDGPRVERLDPRDGLPGTVIALAGPQAVLQAVELQRDSACAHAFQLATRCVTPAFDTLLLRVGDPREFCLSSAELFQRLDEPTVASVGDPGLVTVVTGGGGCLTATANAAGATDAVLVACTRIGICDTTYLHLRASAPGRDDPSPPADGPVAMDDRFVVDVGGRLEVDLLANDRPAGTLSTTTLLSAFRYGSGALNASGRLAYESSGEVCGVVDTASYALCGERGCDTAVAAIRLRCDTLVVFPGFSPNGDGVNDVFLVEGLDDYPGARLLVFNRWGNSVFEAVDYASDWEGRFDGRDLPDGVYFYLLELPGRSSPVTGYLALYR